MRPRKYNATSHAIQWPQNQNQKSKILLSSSTCKRERLAFNDIFSIFLLCLTFLRQLKLSNSDINFLILRTQNNLTQANCLYAYYPD